MSKKRTPTLAFTGLDRPPARPRLALVADAAPVAPAPPAAAQEAPAGKGKRQASRIGRRQVATHVPEEVWMQIRLLIAREPHATVQGLLNEALNDLFIKRGLNTF